MLEPSEQKCWMCTHIFLVFCLPRSRHAVLELMRIAVMLSLSLIFNSSWYFLPFLQHPKCKRHLLRFFLAPKRQTTQHISFGLLLFLPFSWHSSILPIQFLRSRHWSHLAHENANTSVFCIFNTRVKKTHQVNPRHDFSIQQSWRITICYLICHDIAVKSNFNACSFFGMENIELLLMFENRIENRIIAIHCINPNHFPPIFLLLVCFELTQAIIK